MVTNGNGGSVAALPPPLLTLKWILLPAPGVRLSPPDACQHSKHKYSLTGQSPSRIGHLGDSAVEQVGSLAVLQVYRQDIGHLYYSGESSGDDSAP